MRIAAIGLVVAFGLAACAREPSITSTDPWVDAGSPGQTVSVCYSVAQSTREQVMSYVVLECPADSRALTLLGEDSALNDCPVLKRRRATFTCVPPGTAGQIFP